MIDSFVAQRFQCLPIEGAFARAWRTAKYDQVLFVTLGECGWLRGVKILVCQVLQGFEDPFVRFRRFVPEKFFGRLECDANV